MRLLIISDIHYHGGNIREVAGIIRKIKPDHLVLLGDNIDINQGGEPLPILKNFVMKVSKEFTLSRTILMLGDEDYMNLDERKKVLDYVNSLKTFNDNHLLFRKGNMLFSHGNIERSQHIEKVGKKIILFSVAHSLQASIPLGVSITARLLLSARCNYLFLGHMHFLGKVEITRTTFCGTLNRKAMYFKEHSLGYVIVEHRDFIIDSMDKISISPLKQ